MSIAASTAAREGVWSRVWAESLAARAAPPNQGFYAAAGEPRQIWEVPDGGHIGGISARSAAYERRVVAFFDSALLTLLER